jgi:hypothetical protein
MDFSLGLNGPGREINYKVTSNIEIKMEELNLHSPCVLGMEFYFCRSSIRILLSEEKVENECLFFSTLYDRCYGVKQLI